MDDDGLIAAMAAGDDTALRELFSRHASWLAVRLRAGLPAADVEDVLQETFLGAWRGARGYRPAGSASAAGAVAATGAARAAGPTEAEGGAGGWLWGIARRQAALLLRRRGPASAQLPAGVAADWPQATDPADAAQSRADLAAAVAGLGPEGSPEREVWRLMYVEDRPVAEVAALLGVPEGTVKSRAHRTRRRLRAALRGSPVERGRQAAEGGSR